MFEFRLNFILKFLFKFIVHAPFNLFVQVPLNFLLQSGKPDHSHRLRRRMYRKLYKIVGLMHHAEKLKGGF